MVPRRKDMTDAQKTMNRLLEEFDALIEQLERLRELTIAELGAAVEEGADEERNEEPGAKRRIPTRQAAEILGIHPTNLTRVAQVRLIPADRKQGRGGGRGGAYLFSGKELAEAKPHIHDLVREARRLLSPEAEEYRRELEREDEQEYYPSEGGKPAGLEDAPRPRSGRTVAEAVIEDRR